MELYLFQPTTNPKKDKEALDTIQEAFPDREIIGIAAVLLSDSMVLYTVCDAATIKQIKPPIF